MWPTNGKLNEKIRTFEKTKYSQMRAKQILTLALIGVLASCTVSKRIDKLGYRFSFDKKVKSELSSEGQERKADAVQTEEIKLGCNETKTRAAQETATVIRDVTAIPQENQAVGFSNKASEKQRETEVKAAPTFNRKAEKIMKKMVTNQAHGESSRRVDDVVLAILCLFIPPLAVYLYEGGITQRFWINLILTLLFALPGIIHAFVVIFAGK